MSKMTTPSDAERLADELQLAIDEENLAAILLTGMAAIKYLRAKPASPDWRRAEALADEYVTEYEFRGDDGDHVPTEEERALLIDCMHGLLAEEDFIAAIQSKPASQGEGGAVPFAWVRMLGNGIDMDEDCLFTNERDAKDSLENYDQPHEYSILALYSKPLTMAVVGWQYRRKELHQQAHRAGEWLEWENVSVEKAHEIQCYIDAKQGAYELRPLFAAPPQAEQAKDLRVLSEYIAELEKDPANKAALDAGRKGGKTAAAHVKAVLSEQPAEARTERGERALDPNGNPGGDMILSPVQRLHNAEREALALGHAAGFAEGVRAASQHAFDQQSDAPMPGDWNDACVQLSVEIKELQPKEGGR